MNPGSPVAAEAGRRGGGHRSTHGMLGSAPDRGLTGSR